MQICYIGGVDMATVPTQVRIDENLKKKATDLFLQLGMDMSRAMIISPLKLLYIQYM